MSEFPRSRHWIERGDHAREVDIGIASSLHWQELRARLAAQYSGRGLEVVGGYGERASATAVLTWNRLADAEAIVASLLELSDRGPVVITTSNYERYAAGPVLPRPICRHEVLKVIALDAYLQTSRLVSAAPCAEPCPVAEIGPAQVPLASRDALRREVRSLDSARIERTVAGARRALVGASEVARLEVLLRVSAALLVRLGVDPGPAGGAAVGATTSEGAWTGRDREHAAAWVLFREALGDDAGPARIDRQLAEGRPLDGLHRRSLAWLLHHNARRAREELEEEAGKQTERFLALPFLAEHGTAAPAEGGWEPLVMLAKRLVDELRDLRHAGLRPRLSRWPEERLPAATEPVPIWPGIAMVMARFHAALAVAGEADPVSAVFEARRALAASDAPMHGVIAALREVDAAESPSIDAEDAWWQLDPAPWQRACAALLEPGQAGTQGA